MESTEEEMVYRVTTDPLIRFEDRETAIALLLAMQELVSANLVGKVDIINYASLNKYRLQPVAQLLLEKYGDRNA